MFFGVDNTFLTRALDDGHLRAVRARRRSTVPREFQLDPTPPRDPIDYGDVCINYDKAWFARAGRSPVRRPSTTSPKPAYRGRLVVENPATSSPGLAFLLATVAEYGEDGWQRLLGAAARTTT